MDGAPPINEAVNFLEKLAPVTLQHLQTALPQLGEFAKPGGLALEDAQSPQVVDRAKFSQATLHEVKNLCDRGINEAQRRLKRARQLTLFGTITATVGSASVVTALAAAHSKVGMASGLASLAGSIAALLANNFTKLPNGEGSAFDVYQSLTGLKVEARLLEADLEYWLEASTEAKQEILLSDLVGKANDFLRKAYELMTKLESVVVSSHENQHAATANSIGGNSVVLLKG